MLCSSVINAEKQRIRERKPPLLRFSALDFIHSSLKRAGGAEDAAGKERGNEAPKRPMLVVYGMVSDRPQIRA
jgi:hypothetical protein